MQAEQLKLIGMKVHDKYYTEPQRESAMWARKHQPNLAASLPGLPPQALPATMPSLDFRLVWHTGEFWLCTQSRVSTLQHPGRMWSAFCRCETPIKLKPPLCQNQKSTVMGPSPDMHVDVD